MVTETGEVIELSGAMTGGGAPKKGGMSAKHLEEFTDEQITEAENQKA